MSDFPELMIRPDQYRADWFLDGQTFSGMFDGRADSSPRAEIDGEPPGLKAAVRPMPQYLQRNFLYGRLRQGHDVVLGDAHLSVWMIDRTFAAGPWALAGHGLRQREGLTFERARLQITGLDGLFGIAPLKATRFPKEHFETEDPTYSATIDTDAGCSWSAGDMEISADYDGRFHVMDGYEYRLRFAPVLTLESDTALDVETWIVDWLEPLLWVASFLSLSRQRLCWVTMGWDATDGRGRSRQRQAQLFGGALTQVPYEAERPDLDERRPIVSLRNLRHSLVDIVARWRGLDRLEHVFLRLFRLVMFQPELPDSARFQFLVQALESLHATEHADEDDAADQAHSVRRREIIARLKSAGADPQDVRYLNDTWSRRRIDSLDRRLAALIADASEPVQATIGQLRATDIGKALDVDGEHTIEGQLRRVRNDLAHGNVHHDPADLEPWAAAMETLCRVHALRLLGFDGAEIAGFGCWTTDD